MTLDTREGQSMTAPPVPEPARTDRKRLWARVGAIWGLVGVIAIVGDGIVRIWPQTRAGFEHGLTMPQWFVLGGWVAAMVVGEGYRGFQKRFAPRVARRGMHLLHHGRGIDLVLAPLYCMSYFHAPRRQVITSWLLTTGIIGLIVAVRTVEQPWRGIVDAGVLAGLTYGLAAIVVCTVAAVRQAGTGSLSPR